MKRRTMICVSALMALSMVASCKAPDSLKYDLEDIVASSFISEPENVSQWQHYVYMFSGEDCSFFSGPGLPGDMEVSGMHLDVSGETAVAIACASDDNIGTGVMTDGLPSGVYSLKVNDILADVPEIWHGRGYVSGGILMSPMTMDLQFSFVGLPDGIIESVNVGIPYISDCYSISDGMFSIGKAGGGGRSFNVSPSSADKVYRMFPMASDVTEWTFAFSLDCYDGESISGTFNVTAPLAAGSSNTVSVDCSSLAEEGACSVMLSTRSYGSGSTRTWLKKVELEQRQPENRYYDVDVLGSDGEWKSLNPSYALCSNAFRYHTQIWNDWDNSKKLRDTMSFVSVIDDFSGPVKVRVASKKPFSTVEIRPTSYGIVPERIDDRTIEFTVRDYSHRMLSVEFDSDRYHNLMVFGDRPDPDRPDPGNIPAGMKYYGPGEHEVGWITLKEGETLYIDEGATVYAKINVTGDNTAIRGRGVLSGAHLPHTGNIYASGYQLIETNANKVGTRQYFTAEGITVIDSPSWTFSIYNTDHVLIDNIKMICWILNGDGIDLCSVDDGVVKNCFLRSYDDCITLKVNHVSKVDTKNIRLQGNLIWADYARGIVIGPESGWDTGGSISDVIVEDCIILEYPTKLLETSGTYNCDGAGLSISQYPATGHTTSGTTSGIVCRNIIIDKIGTSGRPFVIWQKSGQSGALVDNVLFSNISIDCPDGTAPCHIYTNGGKITGLVIENVKYNGVPMQDSGKLVIDGTDVDITYR